MRKERFIDSLDNRHGEGKLVKYLFFIAGHYDLGMAFSASKSRKAAIMEP